MIAWEESPRQFKMSKQLDEGKFGEDLARKFLNDPIIKVNHGISHYDDVTQDKSRQRYRFHRLEEKWQDLWSGSESGQSQYRKFLPGNLGGLLLHGA